MQAFIYILRLLKRKFVGVFDLPAGTDDSDHNPVCIHCTLYVALTSIDYNRETGVVVSRVEPVSMRMTREHDVDIRLVEDRQE